MKKLKNIHPGDILINNLSFIYYIINIFILINTFIHLEIDL